MPVKASATGLSDDLGQKITECHPIRVVGAVGVILIAVGVGLLALIRLDASPLPTAVAAGISFALLVFGALCANELLRRAYAVHEGGVRIQRGRDWWVYPWHEVTAFWAATAYTFHESTLSTSANLTCKIRWQDGMRLTLGHLSPDFVQWLHQVTHEAMLPGIRADWAAGKTIPFGDVGLSRAGIHCGRRVLPWSKVRSVLSERNGDDVVIRQEGRPTVWMSVHGLLLPNASLFFQLIQEQIGDRGH